MGTYRYISIIAACLIAAALLACGGGKEPVVSQACINHLESLLLVTGDLPSTIKPVREKHFDDWEPKEFAIFVAWFDGAGLQVADFNRSPCDTFFEDFGEWWESDSGTKFQEKIEKWLETDEGKRHAR